MQSATALATSMRRGSVEMIFDQKATGFYWILMVQQVRRCIASASHSAFFEV